jgi:glycosyltransferase involved in cell wall biosynthesis
MQTSAAIQIRDLAETFSILGHKITLFVPDPHIDDTILRSNSKNLQVVKIKIFKMRGVGNARRLLSELSMGFIMARVVSRRLSIENNFDAIICYAPSIFFGPFVRFLKSKNKNAKSLLILRDIFPKWAVDVGILKKGLLYFFLKYIETSFYKIFTLVAIQSNGDIDYVESIDKNNIITISNWLNEVKSFNSGIDLSRTCLKNKKIITYAGNFGHAQNILFLMEIAKKLCEKRDDIGFIFVGDGIYYDRLLNESGDKNILVLKTVPHEEIPNLFAQSTLGLIALDLSITNNNIPGKFISYIRSGLPIFCIANLNIDLVRIIRDFNLGHVNSHDSLDNIVLSIEELLDDNTLLSKLADNCKKYWETNHQTKIIINQILSAIK